MRWVNTKFAFMVKVGFFIWAAFLILRLGELQILKHDAFSRWRLRQSRIIKTIEPRRGTIYDRTGRIMAISVPAYSAYARKALTQEELEKVRRILGLTKKQINYMVKRWSKGDRFTWIKRKMLLEEKKKLEALGIEKIGFLPAFQRVYPHGDVASHILGGVGIDGYGLAGVELYFQKLLGGRPGKREILRDARKFPLDIKTLVPPVPGKDLHLTIDLSIQRAVEKALGQGVKRARAVRGSAIVLNIKGEVVAMASWPDYSPQEFSTVFALHPERTRNSAISMVYEPGSTVKFIDLSAVLQEGKARLGEKIDCGGGKIKIGKTLIRDHKPYYILTLEQVLIHSSNVGAIKLTSRLPDRVFYGYLKKFGLGEKTGIELPGEERGWVPHFSRWYPSTRAYFAIGQGFAVTPIQMVSAALVIATGGVWIKPHLVKGKVKKRRVLTTEVAEEISSMMSKVVEEGTGRKASLQWIGSAGKTGTAEKIRGRKKGYTASFVGMFPYPKPFYVIGVVIDEPRGKHYGGEVAAPVFKQITLYLAKKEKLYPVVMK